MALFSRKSKRPAAPAAAEAPVAAAPEPPAWPRPISLALQGGGAHGAFEWGVLDKLLEDGRLKIEAVTASSAGAVNAVALAAGLAEDGARGARAKLDRLWRAVNQAGGRNVFGDSAIWTAAFNPRWLESNPFYRYFETVMFSSSPYEFNPFNLNPLREVLEDTIDFAAVRTAPVKLFVAATDVLAGKAKIFNSAELKIEAVLASCALPQLFQAVEVDGRSYWDGGYVGDPALWPLFYADTPRDLLLVTINPFQREQLPRTAGEILDRMNEISFNASLLAELRAVAFVQKLIEDGQLTPAAQGRYRHVLTHALGADGALDDLPLHSKFDTEWSFLMDLKARGQKAAAAWLEANVEAVGVRSSLDLRTRFF